MDLAVFTLCAITRTQISSSSSTSLFCFQSKRSVADFLA